MVIVVLTFIGIMVGATTDYELGAQTTIIRSFRIARLFYLFRRNKSLKITFQTFLISLPAMANIGSFILLIIFMYSIFGVYLFADVKLNNQLNEKVNFQTLQRSFLTLIKCLTGEEWPELMESLSRENQIDYDCIQNPTYDDYIRNNSKIYKDFK